MSNNVNNPHVLLILNICSDGIFLVVSFSELWVFNVLYPILQIIDSDK